MGVNITNEGRQRALLLHYAGESVHDIYDAEKSSHAADTASTYEGTKTILNNYFMPKINVQMEIYTFRKCHQRDDQSLDEYATELRQLARNCNFNDVDGEMLSQIIQHCRSNRLRRRALRENDKSLSDILTLGRSLELSDRQANTIESEQKHDVHRVFEKRGNKSYKTQQTEHKWQRHSQMPPNSKTCEKPRHKSQHLHNTPHAGNDKCRNCGGHYPHAESCPAKGKLCNHCHKSNHFATVCRQRKYTPINDLKTSASRPMHDNSSASSNDEYCYGVHGKKTKTPFTVAKLDDVECRLMIDTGASVNILDENTYSQIGKPKLNKRDPIQLVPYGGGKPLTVMGRCAVMVETKRNVQCHEFHVVKGYNGTLLSCTTATELGLIEITNKVTDTTIFASHSETSTPKAMTWHDVRTASIDDIAITKALQLVQNGRWFEIKNVPDSQMQQELKEIARVKDELTSHDGVLLRGTRIVLPTALRNKAVEIAHEGHQGIERTKSLIRSKLWFPRINEMVENTVKACFACQVTNVEPKHMEPLKMSPMPETPWQNLSMDFCGPLSTGEYLLVIIDEHSRYPVVEIVHSVSANTVIPIVDKVLSTFGRPDVIKTDNGSPFNSTAFEKYAENSGFKHRRITPLWPRANAQAEAFNKPMMKAIRTAIVEKKSWKQELHKFLRQYRATPHPSTKYSPYRLLFGREPRTKLPQKSDVKSKKHVEVRAAKNDAHAKSMMKQYADQRNRAVTTNIKIGDTVLLRQDNKCEKSSTPFHTTPYEVINKKGNMVTCQAGGRNVTRNVTWFRKLVTRERTPNETHQ